MIFIVAGGGWQGIWWASTNLNSTIVVLSLSFAESRSADPVAESSKGWRIILFVL